MTTAFLLLAAPCIGSFLGVLVRRLPDGRGWIGGGSRCEACGTRLGVRDLVPIVSYLALHGRCRHCGAPIGPFHPAIELAALAVAASALAAGDPDPWIACALGWTLLALAWIDAERMLLPDALTLPLIVAGLAEAWWTAPDTLLDRSAGAALGWGLFALVAVTYRKLRGREGLGGGDAKLLAAGGAWLGWQALPPVMLIAALLAMTALLIGRAASKADLGDRIPFGPWLALAIWLVWLAGGDL